MALFFNLKKSLKSIALCGLVTVTFNQAVFAQTSSEVKAQLQTVKSDINLLDSNIQKNTSDLAALKTKIAAEEKKIAPKMDEVAKAQSALEQAKTNATEEPSPENNSRVRNAELTLALTERRAERASSTLTEMQEQASELKEKIANDTKAKKSAEDKTLSLTQKISNLNTLEIKAAKDKAAEEQAARQALEQELLAAKAALAKMKQEQLEAEKKAATLKKAEEEKQASEALKAAEAEKAALATAVQEPVANISDAEASTPTTTTATAEELLSTELPPLESTIDSTATESTSTAIATTRQEQSAEDSLDINTDKGYALFHQRKLDEALESDQSRAGRSTGNFLRILNNGRTKTYQWKHATRDLWTLEALVNDGENTFRVGRLRINKTIAPANGEQMYIFQYNDNNPDELIMYRKDLIE